jgi:hypothetical protein
MLYNPKIELNNTTAFVAFLDSKPADEKFNYFDCENCAIGQFAKSKGYSYDDVGEANRQFWNMQIACPDIGAKAVTIALLNSIRCKIPLYTTFGEAAKRAHKMGF